MTKVPFPVQKREWCPTLIPGPISLISTVDQSGTPNVAPKSWLQMVAFEPPTLMFSGSAAGRTETNLLATGCFVVNLVDARLAERAYRCVEWHGAERIARSGFEIVPASAIAAPLVASCRAHLECRLRDTKELGSALVIFGEIVAASIDEELLHGVAGQRYARFQQALFLEEGHYATIYESLPAIPAPVGPEDVRQVILLSDQRPELVDRELVRSHVEHLQRLEDAGLLELCGPFAAGRGGIVILRLDSETEARRIAEADPFVSSGAKSYELRRLELSRRSNRHQGIG